MADSQAQIAAMAQAAVYVDEAAQILRDIRTRVDATVAATGAVYQSGGGTAFRTTMSEWIADFQKITNGLDTIHEGLRGTRNTYQSAIEQDRASANAVVGGSAARKAFVMASNDADSMSISFTGLDTAKEELQAAYVAAKEVTDQLQLKLGQNLSDWAGHARDTYTQVQVAWKKAYDDMALVLANAHAHLGTAAEVYRLAEKQSSASNLPDLGANIPGFDAATELVSRHNASHSQFMTDLNMFQNTLSTLADGTAKTKATYADAGAADQQSATAIHGGATPYNITNVQNGTNNVHSTSTNVQNSTYSVLSGGPIPPSSNGS
jgi:uncharacterized protein YukE